MANMTEPNETIELYRSLVMMSDGEGYTTSRKIAEKFNRPHHNVLNSIDRINAAIKKSQKFEFKHEIFKDANYIDSRGRMRRECIITKGGFLMLAMRSNGAAALEWQLRHFYLARIGHYYLAATHQFRGGGGYVNLYEFLRLAIA